jgi:hypothetical protein
MEIVLLIFRIIFFLFFHRCNKEGDENVDQTFMILPARLNYNVIFFFFANKKCVNAFIERKYILKIYIIFYLLKNKKKSQCV